MRPKVCCRIIGFPSEQGCRGFFDSYVRTSRSLRRAKVGEQSRRPRETGLPDKAAMLRIRVAHAYVFTHTWAGNSRDLTYGETYREHTA